MEGFTAATYGDRIADVYDQWHGTAEHTAATVTALRALAGDSPALELAVGTGRVAIPLAQAGTPVHGIDASEAMLARLRAKPGGELVTTILGDMRDVAVGDERDFSLVYVVVNSFFAMVTQDDQLACLTNAAARLRPGGSFVLECFVPDLGLYDRGQRTSVVHLGVDEVRFDVARLTLNEQRIDAQHVVLSCDGVRLVPVTLRYAWPSELDLMARLAGLRLRHRWSDWTQTPFAEGSGFHISVYEKPG